MPHVPMKEEPDFSRIRASLGSKCVRRTGHGLDGKTATVDAGKGVAAEEHHVRVALVDPQGDLSSVIWISEFHMSEAVVVPLKVGERMIERCGADLPWLSEIVFRVLHGFRAGRKTAFIGSQDSSPRCAQN